MLNSPAVFLGLCHLLAVEFVLVIGNPLTRLMAVGFSTGSNHADLYYLISSLECNAVY